MAIVLYNCKHCKSAKRVEYPLEMRKGIFSRIDSNGTAQPASVWIQATGGGRPTVYGGDVEMGICSGCSKMMTPGLLVGRVRPEHKCDARCLASRGPVCDCSCGGKNHGNSWG